MINTRYNVHEKELYNRLVRIESKLVRGFEELGINIEKEQDWLTVDDAGRQVFVSTLGRSLTVTLNDMARMGATQYGKSYDLIHRGDLVGTLVFRKVI